MKRIALKFAAVVLLASSFAVPAFSQDEKEKEKKEMKEKKESEQIIITKKYSDEKTVIEIIGDKITVNGKPIEDGKDGDVKVHRNKYKTMEGLNAYTFPRGNLAQSWGAGDGYHLFSDVNENRAMLGVVTEDAEGGVRVTEVTKEGAAAKAGIKEGDIITKIGDTKIESPDALSEAVRKHKPGEKVAVTFSRDKKEQKVTAELGKWRGVGAFNFTPGQNLQMTVPDYDFKDLAVPRVRSAPGQAWAWSGGQPRLGLSVQDTDDGKGVKVIEVDEESNAAKAGLKEDDIVTHFNDKEVNSADEVAKLVKESKDKPSIQLKIKRDGKTQNIEVKMPRKLKTADL